jgi:hyaluronate lyase
MRITTILFTGLTAATLIVGGIACSGSTAPQHADPTAAAQPQATSTSAASTTNSNLPALPHVSAPKLPNVKKIVSSIDQTPPQTATATASPSPAATTAPSASATPVSCTDAAQNVAKKATDLKALAQAVTKDMSACTATDGGGSVSNTSSVSSTGGGSSFVSTSSTANGVTKHCTTVSQNGNTTTTCDGN